MLGFNFKRDVKAGLEDVKVFLVRVRNNLTNFESRTINRLDALAVLINSAPNIAGTLKEISTILLEVHKDVKQLPKAPTKKAKESFILDKLPTGANGMLALTLGGSRYYLVGGPYPSKPKAMPGVKLAVEVQADSDIALPIPDFQVPTVEAAQIAVLQAFLLLKGSNVIYMGCMGGIGRTGLFMALMVKTYYTMTGVNSLDPVKEVRRSYMAHAVETDEQYEFVNAFNVTGIAKALTASGIFK